jgi:lipoic acid synthetase
MADYGRSLRVLKKIKELNSGIHTKSGIMVGLGEKRSEISEVLSDLRDVDCNILTVGQYLRPSKAHLDIQEYVHPEVFLEIKEEAEKLGFTYVASAPFVRSSFNAAEAFDLIENGGHGEKR